MKKLHLFKRTLLLLALIVGCVSYGWAAADYTFTLASGDFSATTHSKSSGGITWTHTHGAGGESYAWDDTYGFKFGSGNKSYPTAFTLTSSSFSNKISKIVVTASVNSGKSCKLDAKVGTTTYGSQATINTKDNDTWEFSIADASTVNGVVTLSFSSNTGPLYLKTIEVYYYEEASVTSLSVKTAPTKTNYKVGETLNLTGLVLDADGSDVTSGYTASPANGATLSEVGEKTVTISYGGKETTQTIHVGSLQSIAITTAPTKKEYNQGQDFDAAGMVVKATFSDEETTPTVWEETIAAGDYSVDPSTNLQPANKSVTVSYTWNEVEKTANQTITVNAATAYTVTFNAGTGTCGTSSLTEDAGLAGVTLPNATIGISGWSFAGWATAATGNTEVAPTLYTAGSTYHPIDNCTLYAVYKFTEGTEGEYKRATTVSEITTAGKVVIVSNKESKMLDNTLAGNIAAPEEESSVITAAAKDVFTITGNSTDGYTLKNGSLTIGVTGTSNNTVISNTTTNSTWTINTNSSTTNAFYFENKAKSKLCLEHDGTNWCVYAPSSPSSNTYNCLLIYIPNWTTVYNSNPAAIVNPTIAWTTSGDKTLYLKNTNTYDNAANVTGISKTPVYTSSDATVATVSEAGVVEALKKGTTTIKATVEAETGVNTKAEVSYVVTVKDASNVAGIKAITSTASVVTFTADLTNAVVTYVDGDYAYIQDASGAVYASCGSDLTARKKINGAISGSIKAAYKIDEITAIDLREATVTEDGIIPAADVKTLAEIKAAGTDYDGKLVTISGAKVTAPLTDDANGDITDDGGTTTFKLVCPYTGINVAKDAEGNFTGFVSIYVNSVNTTYRLNIYDQSQIVLTKNAPTAQPLSFESDAVDLSEDTPAYRNFTGQTVSGAEGDVSYSIKDGDDESGIVTSIDDETGAIVLSGNYGTATITATAAAKEVTEAGVTTPYTATTKTYRVTVGPRYSVSFFINGVETILRESAHDVGVTVPTPAAKLGDYDFVGWNTSAIVTPTDDKPNTVTTLDATIYPENNTTKYYAVYGKMKAKDVTATFTAANITATPKQTGNNWKHTNIGINLYISNGQRYTSNTPYTFTVNANNYFEIDTDGGKLNGIEVTLSGSGYLIDHVESGANLATDGTTQNITFSSDMSKVKVYSNTSQIRATVIAVDATINVQGDYCTSLPTVKVTITDAQYATFCYARELSVDGTAVTAYTASANGEGNAVTLTKISDGIIPANTGVILFAESAGNYEINVSETGKGAIAGNELVGVTTRTQIPETSAGMYNYIFSKKGDVIGFYRASGAYLLPNRAYLSTSTKGDAAAREFMAIMFDEGETTSLREVRGLKADVRGEFYNLNGQRVATPVKGNIYIVNGKKVMFK